MIWLSKVAAPAKPAPPVKMAWAHGGSAIQLSTAAVVPISSATTKIHTVRVGRGLGLGRSGGVVIEFISVTGLQAAKMYLQTLVYVCVIGVTHASNRTREVPATAWGLAHWMTYTTTDGLEATPIGVA